MTSGAIQDFVSGFYARPGVSAACLVLQDAHGADVDLVLHLLHLATGSQTMDGPAITALDAAAQPWRDTVIVPLRAVRRQMKRDWPTHPDAPALRQTLAAVEIAAERMQLAFLSATAAATGAAPNPIAAAQASLAAYADQLGRPAGIMAELLVLFAHGLADSNATAG